MARISVILFGITVLIASMIFLITMLFTAPAPDSTGFLTAILCSDGEIMTHRLGERFEQGFFKVNKIPTHLYCQNSAGELREVTGQAFAVVMGGYLVLFLTGLVIFFMGIFGLLRARLAANDPQKAKPKRNPLYD